MLDFSLISVWTAWPYVSLAAAQQSLASVFIPYIAVAAASKPLPALQGEMANRHLYKPGYLAKVIDNLTKIHNEKRKKASKAKKKRKYPTHDEVKQREKMVLSLVKKGVNRIAHLVERSGVPESPVRRYLLKAGYKITAGKVSH